MSLRFTPSGRHGLWFTNLPALSPLCPHSATARGEVAEWRLHPSPGAVGLLTALEAFQAGSVGLALLG